MSGPPIIEDANLEGRFDGHPMRGSTRNDRGAQLAKFGGEVTREGICGTYTQRSGEIGKWQSGRGRRRRWSKVGLNRPAPPCVSC